MKKDICNNALIITSSGGGGLLQAAVAKEQELRRENPDIKIVKKDVMKQWVWRFIGPVSIRIWNKAQRKGNIKVLQWLIDNLYIADKFFWLPIFVKAFTILMRKKIDRVIDTQPVGTSAIIKALRLYNFLRKKNIMLERVVVDLPTKSNRHFFHPVRNLSIKDRKLIKMYTIEPLTEKDQTDEQFWLENCNLKIDQIVYQHYFIRDQFNSKNYKDVFEKDFEISMLAKGKEELAYIKETFSKGNAEVCIEDFNMKTVVRPSDTLFAILLGSQPANQATLNYIKQVVHLAKKAKDKNKKYFLFVFCQNHTPGKNSLLKQIRDFALSLKIFPKSLSIFPLSFQSADVIAPVFARADVTCTRSGGQTLMELMSLAKGKMLIHSEAKGSNPSFESLLKGIPTWEAGSAVYLKEKRGAEVITPQTYSLHIQDYF